MTVHVELRRGAYHDSVSLLQVSRAVAGTEGVEAAQVAMATELNCDVLRGMGFEVPAEAGPNDLVVALRAADAEAVEKGLEAVGHGLAALRSSGDASGTGEDVPPMTLAIGIGLCDAVRMTGAPAVLKWPNDLLVRGRKLAGVLVEAQSQGNKLESVVVGIGINLDGELPLPVAETGITLAEASGHTIDRDAFVTQLLADVERWVDRYVGVGLEAIIPAWQDRMAVGLAAIFDPAPAAFIVIYLGLCAYIVVETINGEPK